MTALPSAQGFYGTPGNSEVFLTVESQFLYGRVIDVFYDDYHISGTSRDTGNTPSTFLRPGLLMGRRTSDKKHYPWNPGATDGTELIAGINVMGMEMQVDGVDQDKFYALVTWGHLKTSGLLIPGEAEFGLEGKDNGALAAEQLRSLGYRLDVPVTSGFTSQSNYTADTTLTAADSGKVISNLGSAGAVNVTLPAASPGLKFAVRGLVAQPLNVLDPNSTFTDEVGGGNGTVASAVIGSWCEIEGVNVGPGVNVYHVYNKQGVALS